MVVMQNLINAIEEIKEKFPDTHLNVIEFGTIRTFEMNPSGQSTACISRALGKHGNFTSVDIDGVHIKISKEVCCNASNTIWIQSDSIAFLKKLKEERFHFAFLDTINDKDFVFKEFCLIIPKMLVDSILMIDDAGIVEGGERIDTNDAAQKGHEVWRFLKSCGANFSVIPWPNLSGTQIKIVLDKKNLELIKLGVRK